MIAVNDNQPALPKGRENWAKLINLDNGKHFWVQKVRLVRGECTPSKLYPYQHDEPVVINLEGTPTVGKVFSNNGERVVIQVEDIFYRIREKCMLIFA